MSAALWKKHFNANCVPRAHHSGEGDEQRLRTQRKGEERAAQRQWWITLDLGKCNISQGWECIINWNSCSVPPCRLLYNCISTLKTIFSRIHNESSIFKMCRQKMLRFHVNESQCMCYTDPESQCLCPCIEHRIDASGLPCSA